MTQQPDTQPGVIAGPLAPGVRSLVAVGWVSIDVPSARVSARQPVVLLGPGGILVIGSHKTSDAVLAGLAGSVTALLPQSLRSAVLMENGHDLQSLPALARALPTRLDGSDIRSAAAALGSLRSGGGLLSVQEFLERTRNAGIGSAKVAEQAVGRVVQVANFFARHALGLGVLIAIVVIALALSTGQKPTPVAGAGGGERPAATQSTTPGTTPGSQVVPFGSSAGGR